MISSKNASLSLSNQSLGLGDVLRQEAEDEIDERKKKLMKQLQLSSMSASSRALLGTSGGTMADLGY